MSEDINIGGILESLNEKLDLDFGNVTAEGKSFISGLGMTSSNRYTDLTMGASGTLYTAPATGWVSVSKNAGIANAYLNLSIDGANNIGFTIHVPYAENYCRCCLPIKKGDKFIVSYNATGATNTFRFIYAEGEEN